MVNIAMLLIASAFGRRDHQRPGFSFRAALPAALINPPALGLAVAVALANRNAPRPAPPAPPAAAPQPQSSSTPTRKRLAARQGRQMLGAVGIPAWVRTGEIPGAPRGAPFFPSFLGYTAAQAQEIGAVAGLKIVEPDEAMLDQTRGVVQHQDPPAGARRHHDMTTVRLVFG